MLFGGWLITEEAIYFIANSSHNLTSLIVTSNISFDEEHITRDFSGTISVLSDPIGIQKSTQGGFNILVHFLNAASQPNAAMVAAMYLGTGATTRVGSTCLGVTTTTSLE